MNSPKDRYFPSDQPDSPPGLGATVRLRPVWDADLDWVARCLSETSPGAWLTGDASGSIDVREIRDAERAGHVLKIVCSSDTDEPKGLVSWKPTGGHREYHLGVLIADPDAWQTGFGARAAIQAVDRLFYMVGAHRVVAMTAEFNPYASKMLAKAGFTLDGVLREYHFLNGKYFNAFVWSLLEAEHTQVVQAAEGTPSQYQGPVPDDVARRGVEQARSLLANPTVPKAWVEDGKL